MEHAIFFKRLALQSSVDESNLEFYKKETDRIIREVYKEVELNKREFSPYLLEYSELYYSFPFICCIHRPIQKYKSSLFSVLSNYFYKNCQYRTKLLLMESITIGLRDLYEKGLCLRTLRPSTIVILGETEEKIEVMFSETRNSCFFETECMQSLSTKCKMLLT